MQHRPGKIRRVYIHVPFCRAKCGYCAFHSLPAPSELEISRYLDKLERDISASAVGLSSLKSIYVGGGTPSYMSERNLERLFGIIRRYFTFSKDAEFTIECNPDTLTDEKIGIISRNVNRVSIGLQTLDRGLQKTIGRITDLRGLQEIIDSFSRNGVVNLSCDLIFGIPGQTRKILEKDIGIVSGLKFTHVSTYFLTFEEGASLSSAYSRNDIAGFEADAAWMLDRLPGLLSGNGFARYEISNYARPGFECRHNLEIWYGDTYAGFGPAASSFNGMDRFTEPRYHDWLDGKKAELDSISAGARKREIIMMGLRTLMGWRADVLKNGHVKISSNCGNMMDLTKKEWACVSVKFENLRKMNLIDIIHLDNGSIHVAPTVKGLDFWNDIGLELI